MGLHLARRPGEAIILSGGIRIIYHGLNRADQACIEIDAPRHIAALREEIARPEQRRSMGHAPSDVQAARERPCEAPWRPIREGDYVGTPSGPGTAQGAVQGAVGLINVRLHRSRTLMAFDQTELTHLAPEGEQEQ